MTSGPTRLATCIEHGEVHALPPEKPERLWARIAGALVTFGWTEFAYRIQAKHAPWRCPECGGGCLPSEGT